MDPKALNAIRLVREMTSGQSCSLAGPIKPKWLTLALPRVGKNRAWIDHVVEGVLCEIINAYRVKGKEPKPFWKGPAYQINRQDLSKQLDCRPRDVSRALTFLEKEGFLTRHRKARYKGGEHAGTVVRVIPDVLAIDRALLAAKAQANSLEGHPGKMAVEDLEPSKDDDVPKVSKFDTSQGKSKHPTQSKLDPPNGKDGPCNLNVPNSARNNSVGRGARQAADATSPASRRLSGSAPDGGGSAATKDGTSRNPDVQNDERQKTTKTPKAKSKRIDRWIYQFLYLWAEAGRRTLNLPQFAVEPGDRKVLRKYLTEHRTSPAWLVAMAIQAWDADASTESRRGFDSAWACRRAKDISTFLSLRSKILNELGALGYEVNQHVTLRRWFTDSELTEIGVNVEPGLDAIEPKFCWENRKNAPQYYHAVGMDMPPEVRATDNARNYSGGLTANER